MNETAPGNDAKKKMERASERTRVYVRAEHAEIEERVVRAIGGETDFEVIVREELVEGEIQKSRGCEQQVLVIASRGDAQDSLRRAHVWKMAAPGLKVLLLGMPERNEDVLFYVRGGVNGFLQINATAKEILDAVRALGRGEAFCSGGVSFVCAAPRPGADAARTAVDSFAYARFDEQRDCKSFLADGEKSSVPDEAKICGTRPAGNSGRLPAARIPGLRFIQSRKSKNRFRTSQKPRRSEWQWGGVCKRVWNSSSRCSNTNRSAS